MPTTKVASEKGLRKLHEISVKIKGTVEFPHNAVVIETKKELELRLTGNGTVNFKYALETLIAIEYAETHYHDTTRNSMLEDINAGIAIVFNNYFPKK